MKKLQPAEIEGEGSYTAARRHRASVKKFIDSGAVSDAARKAAPRDEEEARSLQEAERKGRQKDKS